MPYNNDLGDDLYNGDGERLPEVTFCYVTQQRGKIITYFIILVTRYSLFELGKRSSGNNL